MQQLICHIKYRITHSLPFIILVRVAGSETCPGHTKPEAGIYPGWDTSPYRTPCTHTFMLIYIILCKCTNTCKNIALIIQNKCYSVTTLNNCQLLIHMHLYLTSNLDTVNHADGFEGTLTLTARV